MYAPLLTRAPAPHYITTEGMVEMDKEWRSKLEYRTDPELNKVWVAYTWSDEAQSWLLAGFRRRKAKRIPRSMNRFFATMRRRLGIAKDTPTKVLPLGEALRRAHGDPAWLQEPPERHAFTYRPRKLPKESIVLPTVLSRKQPKRRVRDRAPKFHKKETRFVALGRRRFSERQPGFLYLGPLTETYYSNAVREAEKFFGVIWEVTVIRTADMSKRLRHQIQRGKKVVPGRTRLRWPEFVHIKDLLQMTATDVRVVSRKKKIDLIHLSEELSDKMYKAVAKDNDDKTAARMAELLFVEGLL
jgi:hypothetical protein